MAQKPHNLDAEQLLLGAILNDNSVYAKVCDRLKAAHFYDPLHQRIYAAIEALIVRAKNANAVSLRDYMADDPAIAKSPTGVAYLADLMAASAWSFQPEDHADQLIDLWLRREIIRIAEDAADIAPVFGGDVSTSSIIARLGSQLAALQVPTGEDRSSKRWQMQQIARYVDTDVNTYSTGMPELDQLLGSGIFPSKLYAIAARKKAGKTVLLGQISAAMNAAGIPNLFIALEMTPTEIEQRNIASRLRVHPMRMLLGRRAEHPVDPNDIMDLISNTPDCTWYEGRPSATIEEIEQLIWSYVQTRGVKVVFIDYWQLIGGKQRNDTEEYHIRNVAQRLADIVKRLPVSIIMAAQLNQEGNTRGGEGLKLACDAYLTLNRVDVTDMAWIDLEEARFLAIGSLGSEDQPGLRLNPMGPYFEPF